MRPVAAIGHQTHVLLLDGIKNPLTKSVNAEFEVTAISVGWHLPRAWPS